MIKKDEYGSYGNIYKCPNCGKEYGDVWRHITEQLPILCNDCLNSNETDMNLRMATIIHYIGALQEGVSGLDRVTSGLRIIH